MLELPKALDARGWWTWLRKRPWIVSAFLFLLVAYFDKDYFFAVFAVGVTVTGLADFIDRRRNPRLWWSLVGGGIIVVAAGIYFDVRHDQLPDFFRNILQP